MSIRGTYSPNSAVIRALAYFAVCWIIAGLSGVTATVFGEAIATSSQLQSVEWWMSTVGCLTVIVVAYGVIWPKGTVTHDRRRHTPMVLGFGLLWGISQGQLYLAIRMGAAEINDNRLVIGVLTFGVISTVTGLWHDRYWDLVSDGCAAFSDEAHEATIASLATVSEITTIEDARASF